MVFCVSWWVIIYQTAMNDPCIEHFVKYLEGEKNASEHTISNYVLDIRQFCEITWGEDAQPPYKWKEADRFTARKFLVFFQKLEMAPTTTGRKLSALRSFYKFLLREESGELTPRGQQIVDHTPMGRYGEGEDLLGALVWLVSPAAAFVTGIVVPVDGGFSAFSGV